MATGAFGVMLLRMTQKQFSATQYALFSSIFAIGRTLAPGDEIVVTETITDHSTGRVYPQNVKLTVPVSREEERDIKALHEGEHIGVAKGER